MRLGRNVHKSIMDKVRSTFQAPPASTGLSAYTVYNDAQLRQVMSGTLDVSRTFPKVFLLEAYSRPAESVLPMAIVETRLSQHQPFELGNRNGHRFECYVHILGRMTGERKDLCDLVDEAMDGYVPVNDYTTGSAAFLENGVIENGQVDIQEYVLSRDELRQDAVIDNWSTVGFTLLTTR